MPWKNPDTRTPRSGTGVFRPDVRSGPLSELEVLQAISRAFGSSPDIDEASASAVRWIRAAVGFEDATVRIFLSDRDGRLHALISDGEPHENEDRAAERGLSLETKRPYRADLPSGRAVVTLPLLTRGEAVGVVEVVAPADAVDRRWATLEAVASQVAIVFRNLTQKSALRASFEALQEMASLAGDMVRAGTAEDAVRAAVRFCHERFGFPAAGWLARGEPDRLELVSVRGLGSSRGKELRGRMRTLRGRDLLADEDRRFTAERFAEIAGVTRSEAIVAAEAVILAGGAPSAPHASFRLVETLLEDVLSHLDVVRVAEQRNERLDLGIAWTAHEVRGPLIGALAIIERLMLTSQGNGEDRGLLRKSHSELEQLVGLVDGLLRWAVVGEPLHLERTDLVRLVREAVESCSGEGGTERVTLSGPSEAIVRAQPDHLRGAIANVVRNALTYSPPDEKISVDVRVERSVARVTVRDKGPGVPPEERQSIFDPFMRGSAAAMARGGAAGLGLFIARRVMEAHGGAIWLSGNGRGATFRIQLPVAEGSTPSES